MTQLAPRRDVAALQRRTVAVLTVSQTLGGLGTTVGIAVASVLAEDVSGHESLAGLVQTMQVLGAAAAAYLMSRVMGRRGRRVGLVGGYLTGATGAAVCVLGGATRSFPLLLVGATLLGANSATNYQSRYAAADLASPEGRARALSVVLWATTFGAVLGPNLIGPAGDLADRLDLPRLTGPFVVSVVVVTLAAAVVALLLRPDPLLVAREVAGRDPARPTPRTSWRRVLELARERPGIAAGILAMSSAHAVMVAVMIMTPLHMIHGGAEPQVLGLVISVHVLGMFFFSPALGLMADRAGRPAVLLLGATLLLVALWLAGSSPEGTSGAIAVGLFLLGLGWSCCTVAASTMVTESAPLADRTGVQGASDLLMNVSAAAAGGLAGLVVDHLGFAALNVFAAVLVSGVVLAVALARQQPVATVD